MGPEKLENIVLRVSKKELDLELISQLLALSVWFQYAVKLQLLKQEESRV